MSEPLREKPITGNIRPDGEPLSIQEYERAGGYQGLRKALKMTPREVQDEVEKTNLTGRGGAGYPAGKKWHEVPMGPDARRPKYLVINADEMEPGTNKDRLILEGDPHQLIEGAACAAYAIQADVAYIFLRWAYHTSAKRLRKALAEAYEKGYLGKNILGSGYSLQMHLHVSAGRYMCGDGSGILSALAGQRAVPSTKPPHAATCGLFGKPSIVNNVETLANVHHIINKGWEWHRRLSFTEEGGTKIYAVSGRVKKPGRWELPMGTTAREIIFNHAGGMQDGLAFKGALPGGSSTPFIVDAQLDVPMDFDHLYKAGSGLGTGTMIVLDDKTCPVGACHAMAIFFARESCGWCTPCREGLPWMREMFRAIEEGRGEMEDIDILVQQCKLLHWPNTFCQLAAGALMPFESALKYFRADFERHVREKRCPYK